MRIDEEIWSRHSHDAVGFLAGWRMRSQTMRQGLKQLVCPAAPELYPGWFTGSNASRVARGSDPDLSLK